MKVSCLMLTLDRYEVTRSTFEKNLDALKTEGVEIEYFVWDNGSKDHRTLDYFCELRDLRIVKFYNMASRNLGVAHAFNQLCARAKGEVIVLLGNDIELQVGTLAEAIRYIKAIPRCGIVGVDWGHSGVPPLAEKNGIIAHYLTEQLDKVFGTWFVPRAVIDELGLFAEDYKLYGLEDSSLNNRVNRAGFTSLYIPNTAFKSSHVGTGDHDTGEYRAMKNAALQANLAVHARLEEEYISGKRSPKEPLPIVD